jgi:hypothetical protein
LTICLWVKTLVAFVVILIALYPSLPPSIPVKGLQRELDVLRQFLCNEFKVTPDLRVLGAQLRQTTLRQADGLATWVPRIDTPSGVLRIQATVGSGKTQLALRLNPTGSQACYRNSRRMAVFIC